MDQPTEPAPLPHNGLLARLEKERAHHQSCAALSRTDEGRIAHSGMASGFHIAAIRTVEKFEGPGAAREYMQRTTPEVGVATVATPEPDAAEPALDGALREQYAAAIDGLRDNGGIYSIEDAERDRIAEALLAVRDRRMEQLAAGRQTWKTKALEMERDQDRLAVQVDQLTGRLGQYADRGIANGERAEQAEVILARVRAECDAIARDVRGKNPVALAGFREANARIRAALDGSPAEQPTPEAS